ncbi:MAG: DoxX family protein [Gemmatimonadota bacterium]
MDRRRIMRGVAHALFWLVLVLEVFTMGDAGLGKFDSMEGWMYWFARFGYPPLMAPMVGAVEFVGAGLLLIPSLAPYAALTLVVVMIGALHAVLTTPTDLGWFDPTLHLVFLTIIGTVRWPRRWRPSRSGKDVNGEVIA